MDDWRLLVFSYKGISFLEEINDINKIVKDMQELKFKEINHEM